MHSVTLVDAADLDRWADRIAAQDLLPALVRRLVLATGDGVIEVVFPAGEGVQLSGWDGRLSVERASAFVPEGLSGWEVSTRKDVKTKADEDYEKRSNEPCGVERAKTTFIFVSPRRWNGKHEWVAAREKEGLWRQVKAYDAGDLELWLELAPAVHRWLSIQVGKHPEDATDLESVWASWSATTRPPMTPDLVLAGRGDVIERVTSWLRAPSVPLAMKGESREEAVATFSAVLQKLPIDERLTYLSRALVVRNISAWDQLVLSKDPLILIPSSQGSDTVARAAEKGHHVVIPLGHSDSESDATLRIPRISREEAVKALTAAGVPEDQARKYAILARRSLTAYRRKVAMNPEVQQPPWARPGEGRSLVPAMLAGSWKETKEGDRQSIGALAQASYEELSPVLVRWSNEDEPPLRCIGNAWYVVSKEDAWSQLSRYLTREDLERLRNVVLEVLGTPDPRFDLPEDQRWKAGVLGRNPCHSELLREGLADTLAVMGARGEKSLPATGIPANEVASDIVRRLLERANTDWRVWASLERYLPLLAEAAPEEFLAALEGAVQGDHPLVSDLFKDKDDVVFSSSPHVGLLWSLETIAWSPEYLGHAARLLAKLSRHDPGGKLVNRPMNSLHQIFMLWHPQTTATLDQRLRVLDALLEREPEAAWNLMRQLRPVHQGIGSFTSAPRWREWAPDTSPRVTRAEYLTGIREIIGRMLALAGQRGSRWRDLIEALPALPADQHAAVVEGLESMDTKRLPESDRIAIWEALRQLVSHHRSFPEARWSLPPAQVDRLAKIYSRFEPERHIARFGWLFRSMPDFPEGRKRDWKAHHEEVEKARLEAASTVFAQGGLPALLELVAQVEQPVELGLTVGRSALFVDEEDGLLMTHLAVGDRSRMQFARGFAAGRVYIRGRDWARAKIDKPANSLTPAQRAEILLCSPCDGITWDIAAQAGPDTEQHYWRLVTLYTVQSPAEVERAVRKLIDHGRPITAVELLAFRARDDKPPDPELVVDAIEGAFRTPLGEDEHLDTFSYHLSQLLDFLEAPGRIDETRLAGIEWASLPLLGRYERAPKVLHRELARNPEFFAEILSIAFRAKGEEPRELSDDERGRARHAQNLLESWRAVPGSVGGGTIDRANLMDWVRRARQVTTAGGRGAIGDHMLGQVLSGSPNGADGAWPHEAVRAVIEEAESPDLESGIEVGVRNMRGMVSKHPYEGGDQERQLAEQFDRYTVLTRDRWPRTAQMLRRIADGYRSQGQREDQQSELREDLDH